ncbi:oxidative stress survival, Svf1-like protein [Mariannaea sp. PMI_226]|nr:oxidative stress survival, Svf1-like protein [Mariannaea sp. PMI_226]
MFNWAKQQLANVAGTQEPIYGPSAIQSVAKEAEKTPYTELTRDHLVWQTMDSTSVETQTFYLFSESGHTCLLQVIYSNVAGLRTTCQFNCKIFSSDLSKPHLWCSNPLKDVELNDIKTCFYAQDLAVELSEEGDFYTIKSMNDERAIINVKITRTAPGFQIGETGKTLFGTDLNNPWGSMRHAFWPRCSAEGTISVKEGPIDFKGQALFIHALQGMKPHHAAATWNFANFQGPNYSAIMMEFVTPPSYGTTLVNVGAIAKNGEIVYAGCTNSATHLNVKDDAENDWPEPTGIKYAWNGKTKDGKAVEAVIEGSLGPRVDRVDVMAEVPGFVKKIVAGAAGTKPYIYQFCPNLDLNMTIGDETIEEEGTMFTEATFISDVTGTPSS